MTTDLRTAALLLNHHVVYQTYSHIVEHHLLSRRDFASGRIADISLPVVSGTSALKTLVPGENAVEKGFALLRTSGWLVCVRLDHVRNLWLLSMNINEYVFFFFHLRLEVTICKVLAGLDLAQCPSNKMPPITLLAILGI